MQQESSNGGQNRKDRFLPGSRGLPSDERNLYERRAAQVHDARNLGASRRGFGLSKNPDGTLKPFYLTRTFVYQHEDRVELIVMNYADPTAKIAIAKIEIAGHMFWRGDDPIASGAQKVDSRTKHMR